MAAAVLVGGGTAAVVATTGSDQGPSARETEDPSPEPTEEEEFLALDPAEIADAAEKEMKVLDSVRLAGSFGQRGGGRSELTVTTQGDCAGTFALGGGTAELRSLGGTAWLRPDAAFFGAATGDPAIGAFVAQRLGDRWLLADRQQAKSFDSFCDLDEVFESGGDTSDEDTTIGETREIRGTTTVKVTSIDDAGAESSAFVAVTGPHYVLRIQDPALGRVDFTEFDEPFTVTPPPSDQVVTVQELGQEG